MRTSATAAFGPALLLGLLLALGGCGSATTGTGSGDEPTGIDHRATVNPTDDSTVPDGPGAVSPGPEDLLADTTGDSPFYLQTAEVRVAESYPVQLFLDVTGDAPTPGHAVAYTVEHHGDRIEVVITTQAGEGMSATVLQPHAFAIPLGSAELPVTVDVNDGEIVETVDQ